ncbi:MAG: FKBP-type peptidyl-prolyl cis-trans isomerase [Candidatus Paceibacterota bacterium]|jgi:FKBP-type peptidyl-prolyl cis-trans isomerase
MEGDIKKEIITVIIILLVIALAFFLMMRPKELNAPTTEQNSTTNMDEVKIEVLQEGAGEPSKNGDELTVHYTGTLEDGTKFDSSVDRGTPFTFTLGAGQVIQGWEQGMLNMKVGEKRKLTIPYSLGYGENGYGPIPAKATLIFEVELLKIN